MEQEQKEKQKNDMPTADSIITEVVEEVIDDEVYSELNGFDNPKMEISKHAEQEIVKASQLDSHEDKLVIYQTLVDGKFLPSHIVTAETAFSIAEMGHELGFQPMQAFHQIIPIKGKLTLSAKAQGALLKKGGVIYEVLKYDDYVYLGLEENKPTYSNMPLFKRSSEEFKKHYYTNVTTIRFTRHYKQITGGIKTVVEEVSFTLRDAANQELLTKSNWTKMQPEMLYARALARGANIVAPDLMMGLYSAQEILDGF